jgi:hypothetical protein
MCAPYNVYIRKGDGVGEVREKVEGQQFTRGVENNNMIDFTVSPVYKLY